MEIWIIAGGVLFVSIVLLAILLKPEKAKPLPPKAPKKAPRAPATAKPPTLQKPAPKNNPAKERQNAMQKWVGENPVIAGKLIRIWINEGRKRR